MNKKVDVSLMIALCSGVQLARKNIQRLVIVIGIVALSVVIASTSAEALLMLLVAGVPKVSLVALVVVHSFLFVLANVVVHGFVVWYFKEILRIVRGHIRSFSDLRKSFVRGGQFLIAQVLFALAVSALLLLCAYPLRMLTDYLLLSNSVSILLIFALCMPGLYLAARLCLYPFFFADGKGILGSLYASFMVTDGYALRLIPIGIARIIALFGIIIPLFTFFTIPALLNLGLMLMVGLFLGAIFDLSAAHIYQRLIHPDQAAVPPGVQPLD